MNTRLKLALFLFSFCVIMAILISYGYEKKEQNKQEISTEETVKKEEDKEEQEEIVEKEEEKEEIIEPQLVSLGTFKLTAYCPCKKCCGKWAGGNTASGTKPTANRTIAVDTKVIPFGTKVIINGVTYIAEDTGSAVKGNVIDIYFEDHNVALKFGVKYAEVFLVK